MNRNFENMGNYILLARTVIWLTCKDYMRVVKGLKRMPDNIRLQAEYKQIMDFFRSDDFMAYSLGGNYQFYIRLCNELIAEGKSLPTNAFVKKKGGKNNGKCE